MESTYEFKIYIAGHTPTSSYTVERFERFLKNRFKDQYSLKTIDVLQNPEMAEEDKIIATPSVVKVLPKPSRKIFGDLSDEERVIKALSL
ncbi:MAG: circadian clock protein KaiB [Deltaproteobacteria bacterium]|nr:circadian clock protein KaiB [Deltaproteobacteria bacterium]